MSGSLEYLAKEVYYRSKELAAYYKEKFKSLDIKENVKEFLRNTRVEVYTFAAIGGITAFTLSYNHESAQDKVIPISFSETSQIERIAESMGISVPVETDYLSKTHDLHMNLYECWNDSWTSIGVEQHKSFADELEKKMDPNNHEYRYNIASLLNIVSNKADSLLVKLSYVNDIKKRCSVINQHLQNTYTERHDDESHTEIYFTTSTHTDANGNSYTTTDMHTRQVYDYTDNYFTYFNNYGESSSLKMDEMINLYPNLPLDINLITAKTLGSENEQAIKNSRKEELKDKQVSEDELLKIANSWAYGSQLYQDNQALRGLYNHIKGNADRWRVSKNIAKSYFKRTYDYSHAESPEVELTNTAIDNTAAFAKQADYLLSTIYDTKKSIAQIGTLINDIIKINNGLSKVDIEKKIDQLMDISKENFVTNFPKGVDVDPANYWAIPLWTLFAIATCGGLGYGIDRGAEYLGWYAPKRRKEEI